MLKVVLLLLCLAYSVYCFGRRTNITIVGTVACGYYAARNVEVELYEKDLVDPDDLVNRTKTSKDGYFSIFGSEKEIGDVEFYMKLKHHCKGGLTVKNCNMTEKYKIPKRLYGKTYDMGIISLSIEMAPHTEKCEDK